MSDPALHFRFLGEFITLERAVGGPDPHMRIVCEGLADMFALDDWVGRAWLAGCYVGPYNVPSCEVLLWHWPSPESVLASGAGFDDWVRDQWPKLTFRRERRAIRTPRKFAAHMLAYAAWCLDWADRLAAGDPGRPEDVWGVLMGIPGNGRYGTIKLYEALHRLGVVPIEFPDIRSAGGWSPREMLAKLHPDVADRLLGSDSRLNCDTADTRAARTRADLHAAGVADVDWYTLEVALCEYKQAWDGGQYPGRAHDSELGHVRKVCPRWPDIAFRVLDLRRQMFPPVALGELSGWDGRRDGLGGCPSEHGYMWSDMLYDWHATDDLAAPVVRPDLPADLVAQVLVA